MGAVGTVRASHLKRCEKHQGTARSRWFGLSTQSMKLTSPSARYREGLRRDVHSLKIWTPQEIWTDEERKMESRKSDHRTFDRPSLVEDCWSLDARDLRREGFLQTQEELYAGRLSMRDAGTGATLARIQANWVRLGAGQWIFVRFGIRTGNIVRYYEHPIPIVFTSPQLGGRCAWFLCPILLPNGQHCDRRCARLFLPEDTFVFGCRRCYRLTYASAMAGKRRRARLKVQKIRRRLGGGDDIMEPCPPKPRGMRWKTYRRLKAKTERAVRRMYPRDFRAELEAALAGYGTGEGGWWQTDSESFRAELEEALAQDQTGAREWQHKTGEHSQEQLSEKAVDS